MRSKCWIARSNIAMFREKLAAESDAPKRLILAELLAQEEQKLSQLSGDDN